MKRLLMAATFTTGMFALGTTPQAQASLIVWQTTFNCADWNQKLGLGESSVCGTGDGISGHGGWVTPGHPNGDEITAAANYPGGAGGKGFRHWRADGFDVNGGGVKVNWSATEFSEYWLRYYSRYEAGFNWSPSGRPDFTKEIYVLFDSGASYTLGFHASGWGLQGISPASGNFLTSSWTQIMGGATGDGQWHCYEAHVKRGTTSSNGTIELWVNGGAPYSNTAVNLGGSGGWRSFILGSNQNSPANGGDRYTDYDDVAVSVTGRIGCLSGGTVPPRTPTAPFGLRIL